MPATTVVPRAVATASSSVANGPSSGSAKALTSDPAGPKSRANASGSTTRSAPSGQSSARRDRFTTGSRSEASCTRATRSASVVVTPSSLPPPTRGPRGETAVVDASPDPTGFCGVVLAGGRASRLGGADKASVEHAGRTLLEHAVEALLDATEVVVVGDPVPTTRPVTFTRESPRYGGPVAALLTGRDALAAPPSTLAVLAVDMPLVTPDTFTPLLAAAPGRDGAFLSGPDGRRQRAGVLDLARLDAVRPAVEDQHGMALHRLLAPLDLAQVPSQGAEGRDVESWADLRDL